MVALFDRVEGEIGPVEVAVFNIGANVRFSITRPARAYARSGSWPASAAS